MNSLHLIRHNLSVKEYLELHPAAMLYDEETKAKMKTSSADWHSKNTKHLSEETKGKIAAAHRGKVRGSRSEEYKAKMRDTWAKNKDVWSESIKNSYTEERKKKLSTTQKKKLSERAQPLLNWRENALEAQVRHEFECLGYAVIRNKASDEPIEGSIRYFDFYVPDLNLLVEVDGEYWHRKRVKIDLAKALYAKQHGFDFIRISDRKRKPVLTLLNLTIEERWQEHLLLIESRVDLDS